MSEPLRYQNPELQDMLASNYVAGTLRGPARKRMEALMRANATLARRVHQWESKMQPLHHNTAAVQPKVSTWKAIENAINGVKDPVVASLMSRLNFYKYLSAFALTLTLALGFLLVKPGPAPAPSIAAATTINYVAVLNDNAEQPTMVVTLTQPNRQLTLDMLQKPKLEENQYLQLWAVSRTDGRVSSLGTLKVEKHIETSLTKEEWTLIADSEYLWVSVENQPNLPAPGANIIAKGLCVKVEGWKS